MSAQIMSRHGSIRCQQRGLSPLVIDCLRQFGEEVYDHNGCVVRHFTKRSLRKIEHAWGREPVRRLLHDHRDAYAVFASDDHVVTAGWRRKRIKR
jgi:hypothetical protein